MGVSMFNKRLLFGGKSYPAKAYWGRVIIALSVLLFVLYNFLQTQAAAAQGPTKAHHPVILQMVKAGTFTGDLRKLPHTKPTKQPERPEFEDPESDPIELHTSTSTLSMPSAQLSESSHGGGIAVPSGSVFFRPEQTGMRTGSKTIGFTFKPIILGQYSEIAKRKLILKPAALSPIITFDGLGFAWANNSYPPDPNGDVGPTYYIQTINHGIGIYTKTTGSLVIAISINDFMKGLTGHFGNLCDTDNLGDPVVVYDTFENRWIISDLAFKVTGINIDNPPGTFQCFAVSKSGDPVSGGWEYYSIEISGGVGDYPKLSIWPDGLYMSVNMHDYTTNGLFYSPRVYAFNKAQMYAGASEVQVVSFDVSDAGEFTLLPANARLQTGTPPTNSPNYYAVVWQYTNAISIYKLHVDWSSISTSTFEGPFNSTAPSNWDVVSRPPMTITASSGGGALDAVSVRLMAQNQYTNIGGVESLWDSHTVTNTAAHKAAPRFYQVSVTSGTIGVSTTQAYTYTPDTILNRWMPSVAVDRAGDMAIGYSASSATVSPSLRYAGRLVTDTLNTLPQTETVLYQGTGTQTGSARWGDYSSMTLDPDGCTFWYTNEYYSTTTGANTGLATRIGSFKFPSCTPVGNGGTIIGTVIDASNSNPMNGVTVTFGSRITTTNASGIYKFLNIPAGVYPSIAASYPGYSSSSAGPITVTDNLTTTQNFSLTTSATAGCYVDTTQANFQTGVPTNCDLIGSPNDNVILSLATSSLDQENLNVGNGDEGVTTSLWEAQTFVPGKSGKITQVDLDMFCNGCSGVNPPVTVEIRTTSGGSPTGVILATTTISGFSSGTSSFYSANFSRPLASLSSGTTYAIVIRLQTDRTTGTYRVVRSNNNQYNSGAPFDSTNSGSSWNLNSPDFGFKTYMSDGYLPGTLISNPKDANPSVTDMARWTTLSYSATTPTNTSITFQAAASNSSTGPFIFVGPDGTDSTYFTSTGASLSQFDGFRYLKYKAYLASSDGNNTPTLSDVTVCYSNTSRLTTVSVTSSQNPLLSGQGVTFTVNVTSPGGVPTGTLVFKDNGSNLGITQTLSSGSATIFTSTLPIGLHTITATYSGNAFFNANTGSLVIDQIVTSTATWNGSASTAWNISGNWNTNAVPGSIHSAYLPATGVISEATTSSIVTITNLTIDTGRTLSLGGNLNINGNWSNNGTFTPNSNTVIFIGNNNTQTLSGATTFDNLTINHTGTGGVTAAGSTLNVSNLLNTMSGTLTSGSTFKDVQIGSGTTLANDGGTFYISGNWTNNGTFNASSGSVTFNGAAEQSITGTVVTAFNNLTVISGTRVVIPATNIPTITGTLTVQSGGALKQTRTVSNATVSFLQISSLTSTNKYRGVDLTTINNLGSTTVVITATASNTCPLTDSGSPAYANRCYSITPTTNATATVKLWALTFELNGIAVSNLAPYHHDGGTTWVKLTSLSTGTDGGSYAFGQGNTTGFSPFLLGGPNAPTAITLIDFSAASTSNGYLLLVAPIALALLIVGWRLRRKVGI
jgi:hypothetical protein